MAGFFLIEIFLLKVFEISRHSRSEFNVVLYEKVYREIQVERQISSPIFFLNVLKYDVHETLRSIRELMNVSVSTLRR